MCKQSRALSLRQLLDRCSDPSDPCFQCGWGEFYRRYNSLIHHHVKLNCRKWNAKRLDLQMSETVHDIALEIYAALAQNDFRNLKNVVFRDDEQRFRAYLKRICETSTSHFLKKFFRPMFEKVDVADFVMYIKGTDTQVVWEYYEMVATICRESSSRKSLERDLNIFMMIVFADLSESMVRLHPCFGGLGDRVVELAVFRVREILRGNRI